MIEPVRDRFGALTVFLFGVGSHPEQVDVGSWKWTVRHASAGSVATWRHEDGWDRSVTIVPVHYSMVEVRTPDESVKFGSEQNAIDYAIRWMSEDKNESEI